jgi:hypothetical protein
MKKQAGLSGNFAIALSNNLPRLSLGYSKFGFT